MQISFNSPTLLQGTFPKDPHMPERNVHTFPAALLKRKNGKELDCLSIREGKNYYGTS